ncbi:hypothetical protein [Tolumonas osonensis]|uniref:Uncharacterized protein n=1 Tax=Tolumonas osonensis TaxID=675874 RepID=A0A841GNY8_9GAMM|nr:hypothetical protein [Tolumonas osonensis]MBB6056831.1 hypothetical protein [Tolumonas osonensis]
MGSLKKAIFLILTVLGLFAFSYVFCRFYFAFSKNYSWKEMDWDQNGTTSFFEYIESSDIGKRAVKINDKNCIEYYAFKDGIGIKTVCPKN